MIKRREFIVATALSLAAPLACLGQQGRGYRVAILGSASASFYTQYVEALKGALRELGYAEGRDIAFEYRWAEGNNELLPALASELVSVKVDVIVVQGTLAAQAARKATGVLPIVVISVADPVASGLVASLARPGGNVTGLSNLAGDLAAKHFELLAQVVPGERPFAVLQNIDSPAMAPQLTAAEAAARTLGRRLQVFGVRASGDFESTFTRIALARAAGILVLSEPLFIDNRNRLAELAARNRLPTVFSRSENVDAGGLMSYGPSLVGQYRQAAGYVAKILKGAKPAELPIEQPTRIELVVNRKTAKALGVTIPQTILLSADRVID